MKTIGGAAFCLAMLLFLFGVPVTVYAEPGFRLWGPAAIVLSLLLVALSWRVHLRHDGTQGRMSARRHLLYTYALFLSVTSVLIGIGWLAVPGFWQPVGLLWIAAGLLLGRLYWRRVVPVLPDDPR
ncbi:hypothetical protein AB0F81_24755 [Actinoplanes sp. NPDC024001]|uniref:hypothetical protein n=1 Tax=Actinoplanes sp. NPDC024001 TaxID=3154598 RepID=UPI0033D0D1A6